MEICLEKIQGYAPQKERGDHLDLNYRTLAAAVFMQCCHDVNDKDLDEMTRNRAKFWLKFEGENWLNNLTNADLSHEAYQELLTRVLSGVVSLRILTMGKNEFVYGSGSLFNGKLRRKYGK